MAQDGKQPTTHITDFKGRIRTETSDPTNPRTGDMYFNTAKNSLNYYNGTTWIGTPFND